MASWSGSGGSSCDCTHCAETRTARQEGGREAKLPRGWTGKVLESGDGSGDCIVQIPDARWEQLARKGREIGDVLEVDCSTPGTIRIRNRYAECHQLSSPSD